MGSLRLSHFQSLFRDVVLYGGEGQELLRAVRPGGSLSTTDSIEVYRRAYRVRLTEALGETFEAVWWVLGDRGFFDVAERYVWDHQSKSYNLSDYGERFPGFLRGTREHHEFPFLPDLARFEWSFRTLFHAKQHRSITEDDLATLHHAEDAELVFGEAVELLDLDYAVFDLWKQKGLPHDQRAEVKLNRPQHLLLHKQEKRVRVIELGQPQFAVLRHLKGGLPLSEALDRGLEQGEEGQREMVSMLFQQLFHAGIISKIRVVQ